MTDDPPPTAATRATSGGFAVGPGSVLANRYEIVDYIGKGGMGVVYRAHDRTLDETVAIKILRPQLLDDPSMTQRFLAEIKLARRVTHKNVCRIHDYGQEGSVGFISMQFVDGIELRRIVRAQGGLLVDEAFDIALQLVDGLEAIHDQGIIHRDFKTSNVMVDRRGTAQLMDFGIAKLWEGEGASGLTGFGQIIGTPEYMSPEQAQGEPLDPRSDIYSLGVVLFELFTGIVPFKGDSFGAILYKKIHESLRLDSPEAANLPPSLKPVVEKALATSAADRYPSTRELRTALLAARAQTAADRADTTITISAKVETLRGRASNADAAPAVPPTPGPRPAAVTGRRRRRLLIAAGASLAAVLALALGIATARSLLRSPSSDAAPSPPITSTMPAVQPSLGDSKAAPREPAKPATAAATPQDRDAIACEKGDPAACLAIARAAESSRAFERAATLYVKACDAGSAAGCTALGVLYNRGMGAERDVARAAEYYGRGCTLGDMAGCNNLGTLYQFGAIGFRDIGKARELYDRACANGQMDGCANLGLLMLDTPNLPARELTLARGLLEKACAAGISRACRNVR
jgi:eukaryotic-like serine/threonine-protein kinase